MCEKSHLPFFPLYFSRFFLSLTVLWYCRFGLQGKKVLQYIQIRMIKMDFSFVSCANTMLKMSPLWLHNGIHGMIVNRYQMSQREWKRDNFFYISRSRVSLLCLSFFLSILYVNINWFLFHSGRWMYIVANRTYEKYRRQKSRIKKETTKSIFVGWIQKMLPFPRTLVVHTNM